MKFTLKSAIAMFAALSIPAIAVAPASALAIDRYTITVDCDATLPDGAEEDHNIAPGDLLTITILNCSGIVIWDNDDAGNAFLPGGAVIDATQTQAISSDNFVVTVDGGAGLEIDTTTIGESTDWDIDVNVAYDVGNPAGATLLATETLTFPLGVADMMVREAEIGGLDVFLGEVSTCEVEPGQHIYRNLDFTVTASGEYDFRAVSVNPMDEDMYWMAEEYPNSDPFMVLYEDFNPNDPEAGVVGCNDDSEDNDTAEIEAYWGPADDSLLTGTNYITDDQWPWYRTTLDPGNYSLVIMTPETISTADFDAGQNGATSNNSDTWDPIAQSTTYEMWGPEGGIVLGFEELAPTGGVNPSFALWAGLGVVGIGVAMTVARRREIRN